MKKRPKLATRLPSLSAMARAGEVCAALAERERRDGYTDTADALDRAAEVCEAKALTGAVLLAHRRGYFRDHPDADAMLKARQA